MKAERRADAFNTMSNSPAVLPTATLNEVIAKARMMGGLLSVCRQFNIPTKIRVPIGTPAAKANWHVEADPVESEQVDTAYVQFNGYEVLKVFSISAAAKRMSIAAFESYMIDELTASVLACIEDGLVNGTGSGQGTGILNGITWGSANTVEFTDAVTYPDVVKTVAKLKRGYAGGGMVVHEQRDAVSSVLWPCG